MNIAKHMEVIFVIALTALSLGSWLVERLPAAQAMAHQPVAVERSIATPTSMAVVIIKAPRLRSAN